MTKKSMEIGKSSWINFELGDGYGHRPLGSWLTILGGISGGIIAFMGLLSTYHSFSDFVERPGTLFRESISQVGIGMILVIVSVLANFLFHALTGNKFIFVQASIVEKEDVVATSEGKRT